MNVKFYIFGTPEIFDLYFGTADDISYFQIFYDGSNEDVKLSIHRKANGDVSYSYLRYKFISGSGRTGSFFGMSVVFNGQYCDDTTKLYRLFDTVYKDIILKNNSFISETKGNPQVQAKFLIRNFSERADEAKNIESIILRNIENAFANGILPLDSSFKLGKPNVIRKMNINIDNGILLNALRNYSWVSISPDYSEEIIEQLDKNRIDLFKSKFKEITDFIFENYRKIASNQNISYSEISNHENTITNTLNEIRNYIKNQSELVDLEKDYSKIGNELKSLKSTIKSKKAENKEIDINSFKETKEKIGETEQVNKEDGSKGSDNPIKISLIKNLFCKNPMVKYAVIIGSIIIIVALLFQLKPDYYYDFDMFLKQGDFKSATTELDKLKMQGKDITAENDKLIEKIRSEVGSLKIKNTVEDLEKAKELLEYAAFYGNKDIKQDTLNIALQLNALREKNISPSIDPIPNKDIHNSQEIDDGQSKSMQVENTEVCRIKYGKITKEAAEWYKILEQKFKKKQFDYVINGCSLIINNCQGDIVAKAKELKIKAQVNKGKVSIIKPKADPNSTPTKKGKATVSSGFKTNKR